MMYGVYENKALVHWPPSKIFGDEIKVSLGITVSKFLKPNTFNRSSAHSHRHIASPEQSLTSIVERSM